MTIQNIYKETENISKLYQNWFAFFKPYTSYQHWLVDAKKPEQAIQCPEEMDEIWAFINSTAN